MPSSGRSSPARALCVLAAEIVLADPMGGVVRGGQDLKPVTPTDAYRQSGSYLLVCEPPSLRSPPSGGQSTNILQIDSRSSEVKRPRSWSLMVEPKGRGTTDMLPVPRLSVVRRLRYSQFRRHSVRDLRRESSGNHASLNQGRAAPRLIQQPLAQALNASESAVPSAVLSATSTPPTAYAAKYRFA